MIQPLFPQDDDSQAAQADENYLLRHGHGRKLQPVTPHLSQRHLEPASDTQASADMDNPAVALIRGKLEAAYAEEPSAATEVAQAAQPAPLPRSPHQQFMYDLSTSGRSLAQIQTAWHNYYVSLPDAQKHAVWQEFYAANQRQPSAYSHFINQAQQAPAVAPAASAQPQHSLPSLPAQAVAAVDVPTTTLTHQAVVGGEQPAPARHVDGRSKRRIQKDIIHKVVKSESTRRKAKQHFHSLLFGLSSGAIVLIMFFFGFFNQMIIAPFIQPSRHVSATPIIVDSDSVAATDTPEIIVPKINVQIPVVYDEPSIAEAAVQKALERGVIHYATTVLPGQQGNATYFGHSSNNIFNKGKYKFAFALLRQLVPGDIFYITYDKKVYSYRVFDKQIVTPSQVDVLQPVEDKLAVATLITCDPPGTSTNRLVVRGEQISPDPAAATAPVAMPSTQNTPTQLPSEGPTLWSRFWNAIF